MIPLRETRNGGAGNRAETGAVAALARALADQASTARITMLKCLKGRAVFCVPHSNSTVSFSFVLHCVNGGATVASPKFGLFTSLCVAGLVGR